MKKIFALVTIALTVMAVATVANAQVAVPTVNIRTDKPRYLLGERGTLHITLYNDRETPVSIHNITLVYNQWQGYIHNKWVGNETVDLDLTVKEKGTKFLTSLDFTVPDDGRAAENCQVNVKIGTSMGFEYGSTTIHIAKTPHYMQQIINLLTILVVLLIVCTIILAATIFLSRPRTEKTPIESEEE
ncbi:MAG: hypothetical protein ACOC6G_03800 [Thermoproteota archaeon]